MNIFQRYKVFCEKYKTSDAWKRDQYFNKTGLKLTAIIFPSILALCLLVKKYLGFQDPSFVFAMAAVGIFAVKLGAEYLTRKKFKN